MGRSCAGWLHALPTEWWDEKGYLPLSSLPPARGVWTSLQTSVGPKFVVHIHPGIFKFKDNDVSFFLPLLLDLQLHLFALWHLFLCPVSLR